MTDTEYIDYCKVITSLRGIKIGDRVRVHIDIAADPKQLPIGTVLRKYKSRFVVKTKRSESMYDASELLLELPR